MRLKNESQPTLLGKGPWRGHADMLNSSKTGTMASPSPSPAEHLFQPSNFPLGLFLAEAAQKTGGKEPRSLQSSGSQSVEGVEWGSLWSKEPSNSRRYSQHPFTLSFSHSFLKYLLRIK